MVNELVMKDYLLKSVKRTFRVKTALPITGKLIMCSLDNSLSQTRYVCLESLIGVDICTVRDTFENMHGLFIK